MALHILYISPQVDMKHLQYYYFVSLFGLNLNEIEIGSTWRTGHGIGGYLPISLCNFQAEKG